MEKQATFASRNRFKTIDCMPYTTGINDSKNEVGKLKFITQDLNGLRFALET